MSETPDQDVCEVWIDGPSASMPPACGIHGTVSLSGTCPDCES